MKILVVEDEADLLNSITSYLAKQGYVCEVAGCYKEAQEKLALYRYDCLIVDITLPDGNGLNLLEEIKDRKGETGIIIISAKNSIDDKIRGLNLGADDYLPKPFHFAELSARLNALIRRLKFEGSNIAETGNLKIDLDQREVIVGNSPLILNRKEYELLVFFLSNKNRVVRKSALTEHLWGDNIDQADSFDFLYSQIKNLRRKLADAGATCEIETVYGIGYKFLA
jgi:DNA-binding response OmpR family regulator